jgi:farnesyl diphosphate synthase
MNCVHQIDLFERFKNHFTVFNEILINQLTKSFPDLPQSSLDRIKKMAEYNVPHGKLNRGLMVVEAFYEFNSGKFTNDQLMKAFCLGWCIEWCQAYFLVADDVMDSSLMRRGQPCWFRQPDVGLIAINDALILRSSLNLLLKEQFKENDQIYFKFSELFREVELSTEMGQMLDMTSCYDETKRSEDLMTRYELITKYKTSLYTFYLPFACAYILNNQNQNKSSFDIEKERDILIDIGHLFQVQDDILDVFGDPKITGKVGTDIEEGKYTWLLCKCLSLPKLLESDSLLLKESRDKSIVKEIYERNEILNHFEEFEMEMKTKIENSILKLSNESSSRILRKYLEKIMKRIK